MKKFLGSVALVAGLSAAAPMFAQDADANSESNDAAVGFSQGEPVNPGLPSKDSAQVGQEYLLESHGDWDIRCAKTENGVDPCQLYQLISNAEADVAEISLYPLKDAGLVAAGATIITPLGTMLEQGVVLVVDETEGRRYPYTFCSNIGCVARVGLTNTDIEGFKEGTKGTVKLVPVQAPNTEVEAYMSLSGFTAAYTKIQEIAAAQ
ncbi:invasion associated locus B family protein [Halocynthiibacter sp. C4]|uniref:invasion associated locus B family protein n=1 Tax=Halocynthiibacter sp. C4 TaxID=2992758 RepID=UPI00237AFCF2|nr:invasion associated locus B family protein [Halocynthiibacter sp. C4]MDE0589537.1 invasion associated locus B family protein [Halocynthiibacter sp. C4]